MVDTYGRWIEEKDYSTYPKDKWCDMDYMAAWIRSTGYEPKTSMENLINKIILAYREDGFDRRSFPNNLMIHIPTASLYVQNNGGLKEFDYE